MYDFTLIVPEGAFASSVILTLDVLATAGKLAPRAGVVAPRWRICGLRAGMLELGSGLQIRVEALPVRARAQDCWILPGLDLDDAAQVATRLAQPDIAPIAAALSHHVRSGGTVAGSCSSAFLLNAAGLLDGRCVTTTWWLATALRDAAPLARVEPDRMVHSDGPLITAGAALAHVDLLLHLMRQRFGGVLADLLGNALLVERRRLQSPYMYPTMMAPENRLIEQLSRYIAESMPAPVTVEALAAKVSMSTRTLNRHVTQALGYGPQQLIQAIRLNRARALLEASGHSVEEVAAQVGLGDATALRRLLRRRLDMTPTQARG